MKKHAKNLKEAIKHGNLHFPLATYEITDTACIVQHHWHEEIEMLYIPKGHCILEIDMVKIQVDAPSFFFINKEQLHYLDVTADCTEQALVFNLGMLAFEELDYVQMHFIKPLLTGSMVFPGFVDASSSPGQKLIRPFGEILQAANQTSPSGYLKIKSALLNILFILAEHELFVSADTPGHPLNNQRLMTIKKVLAFLRENYTQKLYLKDLAEIANMDEQYFCRFFRQGIGKTPTEYLNELRIRNAAQLLLESDDKILPIALSCGFHNLGYFITRFHRLMGCTPSQYRGEHVKKSK